MFSEAIIAAIAEAVIGYALGESGLGNWVRARLSETPAKRAFATALEYALKNTVKEHPEAKVSLFDAHFLQYEGAEVIGQLLWRHGRPTGEALALAWAASVGNVRVHNDILQSVTNWADYFLTQLEAEAKKQPDLQNLFDRRAREQTSSDIASIENNTVAQLEVQRESLEVHRQLVDLMYERLPVMPIRRANSPRVNLRHNLPGKDYPYLVGRQNEFVNIVAWLHPSSHHHVVAIEGIGGIGKSALALTVAHHYLEQYLLLAPEEQFDAIVWASAKLVSFDVNGTSMRLNPKTTLDRIYSTIAVVLEDEAITRASDDERDEVVKRALIRTRTLIVVDNLETANDPRVLAFLREIPTPSKALVTTQIRQGIWPSSVCLDEFTRPELKSYLEQWPRAYACLKDYQLDQLYTSLGGIPLALRLCFSSVERAEDFDHWIARLEVLTEYDVLAFCVQNNWQHLQQESTRACEILKLLTLFDTSSGVNLETLHALFKDKATMREIEQECTRIAKLSLAYRRPNGRITVLPLVQKYVGRYLTANEYHTGRQCQMDLYLNTCLQPYIAHVDFVCGRDTATDDIFEVQNLEIILEWARTLQTSVDYLRFVDGFSSLLYLIGFVKRAIEISSFALNIAHQNKDYVKAYDFYCKLGLYYTWSDKFREAEQMLQSALQLREHLNGYRLDNVLDYYGAYLMRRAQGTDLYDAYDFIAQSTTIRENFDADEKDRRVAVLGRFLMGVWYYRAAMKVRQEEGIPPQIAVLIEQLGVSVSQSPAKITDYLLTQSEIWLQKGLVLTETMSFPRGHSYILNYLGNIFTVRQSPEDAEWALSLALELAEKVVDRRRIARVQESFFYLYRTQGDIEKADFWANVALTGFDSLGMIQEIRGIQDELGRI